MFTGDFQTLVVAEDGESLPHPGGDGLVVEDDRSATSEVHWLTILVDHIVVHSDDDNDEDNDNVDGSKDLSKKTRQKKTCQRWRVCKDLGQ